MTCPRSAPRSSRRSPRACTHARARARNRELVGRPHRAAARPSQTVELRLDGRDGTRGAVAVALGVLQSSLGGSQLVLRALELHLQLPLPGAPPLLSAAPLGRLRTTPPST